MSGSERRRSPRYPCSAEIEIGWGSAILRASLRDISSSGMFIQTNDPLWVRAEFSAQVLLLEPIDVNCVVRRVEPGRGMGVELKDLSERTRKSLDELLSKLGGG